MFPRFQPASGPSRPDPTARVVALLCALTISIAACAGGATPSPSGPAPTASIAAPSTAAPATPSPTPTPAFPTTVTDDEGTAVDLAAEPDVIVSLTPAATETLFALGVGDRIVGKGEDFFLYPPAAAAIPDVATFDGVDVEKIVSLQPDVVFAGGNFFTPPDAIDRMRDLGLTVVVLYAALGRGRLRRHRPDRPGHGPNRRSDGDGRPHASPGSTTSRRPSPDCPGRGCSTSSTPPARSTDRPTIPSSPR